MVAAGVPMKYSANAFWIQKIMWPNNDKLSRDFTNLMTYLDCYHISDTVGFVLKDSPEC